MKTLAPPAIFAAIMLGAQPAIAQNNGEEIEALRAEVAVLKAQIAALSAKVDAVAVTPPAAAPEPAKQGGPTIKFKGAPEISTADGWSFKPRGRLQIDAVSINPLGTISGANVGTATRLRRLYLGFEGAMPGGFGYRFDADFANSNVDLADIYLSYKAGNATIILGQQKPFWGLEEMTSDLFTSFDERASYEGAFGFERRVGLSASYLNKNVLIQGGVFADNAADLNNDSNNSRSFDGRVVFMPKIGKTQLHFGSSVHFRKFNDAMSSARYRVRPFTRATDLRFVDTRSFSATGENSFGLEAMASSGRFHAQAEGHWLTAKRPGTFADPKFFGSYVQLGYFLTDDTLGYKNGSIDRTKVSKPLGKNGWGALQVNARYDYLDLIDAGIVGGKQEAFGLSLIWIPIDYVRFIANYGHLELTDAAVLASGRNDFDAEIIGLRAQIDF
jgi:phosphate-selective porin OprO and OprP